MKRISDCLIAFGTLILFSPLFVALSLAIKLSTGGPVFFRQLRGGRAGKPFFILKFRTMRDARDSAGVLLPDGDRLTTVGRYIRSTSLDELPQMWNVLRGDMSLVGPRPLLASYTPLYSPRYRRRLDVRPGLTGWAQVNGRNGLSWDQKFEFDLWYLNHRSFLLDLRIIGATVWDVVRKQGISSVGHATMPEFRGSQNSSM
jgi:lipopolysaccharide/colanic/teichoic acid biosynthesis glycosyltransferase